MKLFSLLFQTTFFLGALFAMGCTADPMKTQESITGIYNIRNFGAVGDGLALDTRAISRAVSACSCAGGGTVLVPPGRFLSGSFELKSHVSLRLAEGATLLASQNVNDYPLVEFGWDSTKHWISPLIYVHDAEQVTVCGSGTIEGQGASWWKPIQDLKKKQKAEKKKHKKSAATTQAATKPKPFSEDLPDASAQNPRGRPELIRFMRCTEVAVDGITLHNAPEWNIHPIFCERVLVNGIVIDAPSDSPNTDGINPESCKTVMISNCRISNGDDCITLKSGLNEYGRQIALPDEDITITNCVTYHGHGGVTIGSEMSGGVHNVVVSNCVFHGTDTGIRIKTQRGRGGVVEGITFNNIVMQDVPHPIMITSFYFDKANSKEKHSVDITTPTLRNIQISNINVRGAHEAGVVTGLNELPISDVTFQNVHIEALHAMECTDASDMRFNDCIFRTSDDSALICKDCKGVNSERLQSIFAPSTMPSETEPDTDNE